MDDEERAKRLFFEALDDIDQRDAVSAERKLREAMRLAPDRASIHTNLAFILFYQNRFEEAHGFARRATELDQGDAEAWLVLGSCLIRLGGFNDALAPFERAVALTPDDPEAQAGRGLAFYHLGRFAEAAVAYEAALRIEPRCRYLRGELALAKLNACNWSGLEDDFSKIRAGLTNSEFVSRPFPLIAMPIDAELQLKCARIFAADDYPVHPQPLWHGERYAHDRIRVAYVSPDFREHAVSYLTAGIFEHHDRKRFEIVGISLGGNDGSKMRTRLESAFEHFVDAHGRTDEDIAGLIRGMEIDVAVDLAGVTFGSRPRVFARRPAPVQVNYLGYPASMGSTCMDYMIADPFVVPVASQRFYAEKIAYLPDCFQSNDDKRPLLSAAPSRMAAGLPESGFVFCSFNSIHKVLPGVFDIWMRLLSAVPGSILWSVAGDPARDNLRREAERRGVDSRRLIFAGRLGYQEHLTRFQLADLFLDTLPFNAGTTASDALWAGVPVVTCAGETFASRMAGSLVRTAGLPELVTNNLTDYEALALGLALDPARLAAMRQRLADNRRMSPLFDTERFTRHLEAAYTAMSERTQRGVDPATFTVPPLALN